MKRTKVDFVHLPTVFQSVALALFTVISALCDHGNSRAQVLVVTPIPPVISISTDSIIAEARKEAIKRVQPELEFELVKERIKRIVDFSRASDSQPVSIASPGSFRAWLRSVQMRTGRSYEDMALKIVEAVAPNACPDLEEHPHFRDYIRDYRISGPSIETEQYLPPLLPKSEIGELPSTESPAPSHTPYSFAPVAGASKEKRLSAGKGKAVTTMSIEFSRPTPTPILKKKSR